MAGGNFHGKTKRKKSRESAARKLVCLANELPSLLSDFLICQGAGLSIPYKWKPIRVIMAEADRLRAAAGNRDTKGWHSLRKFVFARDKMICGYCRQLIVGEPHCDHIYPHILGGSNKAHNLVTSCGQCNIKKGGNILTASEFTKVMEFIGATDSVIKTAKEDQLAAKPRPRASEQVAIGNPDSFLQYESKRKANARVDKAARMVKCHHSIPAHVKWNHICEYLGIQAPTRIDRKLAILKESDRIRSITERKFELKPVEVEPDSSQYSDFEKHKAKIEFTEVDQEGVRRVWLSNGGFYAIGPVTLRKSY